MKPHTNHRHGIAAILCCAAAAAALSPGTLAARSASNVLYIKSNDARPGMNSVFAFHRAADGSLTPLPGSPFLTLGTGVDDPTDSVGPADSDQDLIASPDGKLLFVPNGGSNTVAVFQIALDGTLSHVSGSPFPSGGVDPVSVGYDNGKLYVVNKNEDPAQLPNAAVPNYTGFRVNGDGGLIPITGSTVNLPARSSPSQALVSPDGQFVFGADIALDFNPGTGSEYFGTPVLHSFRVQPNGRLNEAPGSPLQLPDVFGPPLFFLPPNARIPLGLAAHPTQPVLYAGVVSSGDLAAYSFDGGTGQLTFQGSAHLSGVAPCWLAINQAGTRLYTANTLDTSVSVVDTSDALHPVEIQHVVLGGGLFDAFNESLDPSGSFLYVLGQRSNGIGLPPGVNAVHIMQVAADGTLTEAPFSPYLLPAGDTYRAQGVVVR